jgi:hypothetical protein
MALRPAGALDFALGRGARFAAGPAVVVPIFFLRRTGAGLARRQPVEPLETSPTIFRPPARFKCLNWLGVAYLPQPLNPFSLAAAHLTPWWFFTAYAPVMATLALLAMAAFLRELELSGPRRFLAA